MKIQIALVTFVLSLISCTSAGIVTNKSHLFLKDQDLPLVTVIRQSQIAGSAVTLPVILDGEVIAHLGTGDYVELHVSRGEHYITMDSEGDYGKVIRFNAKDRDKYYFHLSADIWSGKDVLPFIELTPGEAHKILSTNSYDLLTTDP